MEEELRGQREEKGALRSRGRRRSLQRASPCGGVAGRGAAVLGPAAEQAGEEGQHAADGAAPTLRRHGRGSGSRVELRSVDALTAARYRHATRRSSRRSPPNEDDERVQRFPYMVIRGRKGRHSARHVSMRVTRDVRRGTRGSAALARTAHTQVRETRRSQDSTRQGFATLASFATSRHSLRPCRRQTFEVLGSVEASRHNARTERLTTTPPHGRTHQAPKGDDCVRGKSKGMLPLHYRQPRPAPALGRTFGHRPGIEPGSPTPKVEVSPQLRTHLLETQRSDRGFNGIHCQRTRDRFYTNMLRCARLAGMRVCLVPRNEAKLIVQDSRRLGDDASARYGWKE